MRNLVINSIVLSSVVFAGIVPAFAVQQDSALFPNKYEGDIYAGPWTTNFQPTVPGYGETRSTVTTPAFLETGFAGAEDGNVLTIQNEIGGGNGFYVNGTGVWPVLDSVGWTIEFRAKIDDNAAEGSLGAFGATFGDGNNSLGNNWQQLVIGKSFVATNLGGNVLSTSTNTDGFHTFRVAQVANSNTTQVWRDGVAIGTATVGTHNFPPDFVWGDWSGSMGGPTYHVDYVRWTDLGGFEPVTAPIPEPSSFALMGVGVAFACRCYRRRRQR